MKPGTQKHRTVFVNLVLLVISSGLTILSVDLILRLSADTLIYYRPHEMFIEKYPELPLVDRYKRNIDYSGQTYGDLAAMIGKEHFREKRDIVFKTDSFGFRNNEDASQHDTYDLIIVGDSFGVGTGTTQDRTWATLMQNRYGLKTYNLSMAGSPWQHYIHLATEIPRLRLHSKSIILLTLFSGNDLDEFYYSHNVAFSDLPWNGTLAKLGVRVNTFVKRSPIRQLVIRYFRGNKASKVVMVEDFLDERKILFFLPYAITKNRSEAMIQMFPKYNKLLDAILNINRIASAHNSALVILLLPSKEEVYEWVLEGSLPWTTQPTPSGFTMALNTFCRQNNLNCFDLKPSLVEASEKTFKESGDLIYWTDDTHWNENGHNIVADIVSGLLNSLPEPGRDVASQ